MKKAILLVNLGSPDSYQVKDVRRYLDQFLMDERVIDFSRAFRTFLIKGIVLNTRPKKSAQAYRSIWWDEGAPLLVLSERLQKKVAEASAFPVGLAMRYGNPSLEAAFAGMCSEHPELEEVAVIPLYPHYAMSSYETVAVEAQRVAAAHFPHLRIKVQPPFYRDNRYLAILSQSLLEGLPDQYDHVLFSYHGIPERHVRKSDLTGAHCLCHADCCRRDSPAHQTCYRHQTQETTARVAEALALPADRFSTSYQSRLGPIPWLKPFTDQRIAQLAQEGVKKLVVLCPAFVSDCLETIEEIGEEGREIFLEHGGEEFTLVPCLNDRGDWSQYLADLGTALLEEPRYALPSWKTKP